MKISKDELLLISNVVSLVCTGNYKQAAKLILKNNDVFQEANLKINFCISLVFPSLIPISGSSPGMDVYQLALYDFAWRSIKKIENTKNMQMANKRIIKNDILVGFDGDPSRLLSDRGFNQAIDACDFLLRKLAPRENNGEIIIPAGLTPASSIEKDDLFGLTKNILDCYMLILGTIDKTQSNPNIKYDELRDLMGTMPRAQLVNQPQIYCDIGAIYEGSLSQVSIDRYALLSSAQYVPARIILEFPRSIFSGSGYLCSAPRAIAFTSGVEAMSLAASQLTGAPIGDLDMAVRDILALGISALFSRDISAEDFRDPNKYDIIAYKIREATTTGDLQKNPMSDLEYFTYVPDKNLDIRYEDEPCVGARLAKCHMFNSIAFLTKASGGAWISRPLLCGLVQVCSSHFKIGYLPLRFLCEYMKYKRERAEYMTMVCHSAHSYIDSPDTWKPALRNPVTLALSKRMINVVDCFAYTMPGTPAWESLKKMCMPSKDSGDQPYVDVLYCEEVPWDKLNQEYFGDTNEEEVMAADSRAKPRYGNLAIWQPVDTLLVRPVAFSCEYDSSVNPRIYDSLSRVAINLQIAAYNIIYNDQRVLTGGIHEYFENREPLWCESFSLLALYPHIHICHVCHSNRGWREWHAADYDSILDEFTKQAITDDILTKIYDESRESEIRREISFSYKIHTYIKIIMNLKKAGCPIDDDDVAKRVIDEVNRLNNILMDRIE